MSRIFVSYRRDDAQGEAGHLLADLRRRFGDERVFMDIAGIRPGEDFGLAIERAIAGCSVVLVLIGRGWLDARDHQGGRRLDDPADWVGLEVQAALQGTRLVIPVLVQGASMPSEAALPASLRPLARRHAHEISARRWDFDFDGLASSLAVAMDLGELPRRDGSVGRSSARPPARSWWRLLLPGGVAMVALVTAVIWWGERGDGGTGGIAAPTGRDGPGESSNVVPDKVVPGFFGAPARDHSQSEAFRTFDRLSIELAAQSSPSDATLREFALASVDACAPGQTVCHEAVNSRVRSTYDAICLRRLAAAETTDIDFAKLRNEMRFLSCVQAMQSTVLDELHKKSQDAIRWIKAG